MARMNEKEALEFLKEKGYKIEKPKFAEVQHSYTKNVLLETKNGNWLVKTWGQKEDLNDFEYFEEREKGHFWINGNVCPFQIKINGRWIRCNEFAPVRFLRE